MRSARSLLPSIALAIALVAVPALALAAAAGTTSTTSASSQALTKPVRTDVQLWPSETDAAKNTPVAFVLVSAVVPTETPLPCTVALPIPAGATLDWAGEISGSGPANDVEREPVIADGTGGKVARITLEKFRTVQYEATFAVPEQSGETYTSILEWVQSTPADSVLFGVKFAAKATDTQITPAPEGAPQFAESGEKLYLLAPRELKTGEDFELKTTFALGEGESAATADPSAEPSTSADSTRLIVLVVAGSALVATVIALVYIVTRKKRDEERLERAAAAAADTRDPGDAGSPVKPSGTATGDPDPDGDDFDVSGAFEDE